MFRTILVTALLGVSATLLADGVAPAATPPAQSTTAPAPGSAKAAAKADDTDAQNQPVAGCVQDTGTHLRTKPGDCLSSPGRSYDSDEIRSTGATNNADALRKMDPSLTTTH